MAASTTVSHLCMFPNHAHCVCWPLWLLTVTAVSSPFSSITLLRTGHDRLLCLLVMTNVPFCSSLPQEGMLLYHVCCYSQTRGCAGRVHPVNTIIHASKLSAKLNATIGHFSLELSLEIACVCTHFIQEHMQCTYTVQQL